MPDALQRALLARYVMLSRAWRARWPQDPIPDAPEDAEGLSRVCRQMTARLNAQTPLRVTTDPTPFRIPERRRPPVVG